jgi:REP element-mobilizing transposase RayT
MGRTRRSYLPGAVFHLTARTQGHEPWFTDALRPRIVEYIASATIVSDVQLLAYAVMSNHLHLVLRQGGRPLGAVMQPLLRRIAGLVQRSRGAEGHVFERRFNDRACLDPAYVRNSIVYTNLNPVRAGVVARAADYPWSSAAAYQDDGGGPECMIPVLALETGLGLFAPREGLGVDQLRRAYGRYTGWRIRCDHHRAAEELGHGVGAPPPPPPVRSGDLSWTRTFAETVHVSGPASNGGQPPDSRARLDLSDIARTIMAAHAPDLSLDVVRSPYRGRDVVRVRHLMVRRLNNAGYPGGAIARYLRVSEQCVSKILTQHSRRAASSAT